jgi:hypothetical protein
VDGALGLVCCGRKNVRSKQRNTFLELSEGGKEGREKGEHCRSTIPFFHWHPLWSQAQLGRRVVDFSAGVEMEPPRKTYPTLFRVHLLTPICGYLDQFVGGQVVPESHRVEMKVLGRE